MRSIPEWNLEASLSALITWCVIIMVFGGETESLNCDGQRKLTYFSTVIGGGDAHVGAFSLFVSIQVHCILDQFSFHRPNQEHCGISYAYKESEFSSFYSC